MDAELESWVESEVAQDGEVTCPGCGDVVWEEGDGDPVDALEDHLLVCPGG